MSNAAKFRKKAAEFELQKQFDKAIASYMRAIEAGDASGEEVDVALLNKVGDLTLRLGRVAEAVASYERAVDHYAAVGLFNNAIALCNKILRHAPGRVGIYLTLGRVCARKGMRGDATRNFLEYAGRMKQEGRTDEAMRSLAEVAGLMPELEEVRRLVEEHAARAGIALPVAAEAEVGASRSAGGKTDGLVFLDVDYDSAVELTPPLGAAVVAPVPPVARPGSPPPPAPARTSSLDDLLIFDPASLDDDVDSAEPVDGLEATHAEVPVEEVVEAPSLLPEPVEVPDEIADAPDGLTDALGLEPALPADVSGTETLEGLVSDEEDAPLLVEELVGEASGGEEVVEASGEEIVEAVETGESPEVAESEVEAEPEADIAEVEVVEVVEAEPVVAMEEVVEVENAVETEEIAEDEEVVELEAVPEAEEIVELEAVPEAEETVEEPDTTVFGSVVDDDSQDVVWVDLEKHDLTSDVNDVAEQGSDPADALSLDLSALESETPASDEPLPFIDFDTPGDDHAPVIFDIDALESLGGDDMPAEPLEAIEGLEVEEPDIELPMLDGLPPLDDDTEADFIEPDADLVDADLIGTLDDALSTPLYSPTVELEFLDVESLPDFMPEEPVRIPTPVRSAAPVTYRRLDPHDFILPGELPPIVLPDAVVHAALGQASASEPVPELLDLDTIEPGDAEATSDPLDLEPLDPEPLDPEPVDASLEPEPFTSLDQDAFEPSDTPAFDADFDDLDPILTPRTPTVAMHLALDRCARLREEVDQHPGDWALRRRLAEALLEAGELDAGLDELSATVLGLEVEGALSDAARVTDDLIRVAPDVIPHHQKRVELAVRLGDRDRLRESYLDLADALVRTGLAPRAEPVYVRVLELDPWDDRARAALGDAAPPPPAPKPVVDDGYVSFAEWMADDSDTPDTRMRLREPTVTGDEDADFDRLLQQFREGVSRNLGDEDYESHYDLGVAYKEMGLLDDAIAEFQRALRSPTHRLPAYEALGQCFLEQGSYPVAVTVLSRALHEPGLDDEQRVGVLYLLGYACEALQRRDEARRYFERVYATDIHFRDVADRLAALDRGA